MLSSGATGTLEPPMVGAELAMDSWFFPALMFAIFVVPVILLFGYALLDVVRRPGMGVAARALWLIGFCVLPIIGPLVYLVINPPGSREMEARLAGDDATRTVRAHVAREPARPGQADRRGVPAGQAAAASTARARPCRARCAHSEEVSCSRRSRCRQTGRPARIRRRATGRTTPSVTARCATSSPRSGPPPHAIYGIIVSSACDGVGARRLGREAGCRRPRHPADLLGGRALRARDGSADSPLPGADGRSAAQSSGHRLGAGQRLVPASGRPARGAAFWAPAWTTQSWPPSSAPRCCSSRRGGRSAGEPRLSPSARLLSALCSGAFGAVMIAAQGPAALMGRHAAPDRADDDAHRAGRRPGVPGRRQRLGARRPAAGAPRDRAARRRRPARGGARSGTLLGRPRAVRCRGCSPASPTGPRRWGSSRCVYAVGSASSADPPGVPRHPLPDPDARGRADEPGDDPALDRGVRGGGLQVRAVGSPRGRPRHA